MGLIDQETLDLALEAQKNRPDKIGKILVDMGIIDNYSAAIGLALQLDIPPVKLAEEEISASAIALISASVAKKLRVIPLRETEKGLVVAFADPLALNAIDEMSFATNMNIEPVIADKEDIETALVAHYNVSLTDETEELNTPKSLGIEIIQQTGDTSKDVDDADLAKLANQAELAPVVKFLNAIITDAITQRASDIHIEPGKTKVIIRYRIDGMLQEAMQAETYLQASLVSRVKIISNMDISIRRKPQDGKAKIKLNGRGYDLRASTIPTTYGEKVTLRILDSNQSSIGLDQMGFSPANLKQMAEAIESPQGIVLVTGPTGSGKSSTLYACLNHLKTPEVNIITLEDPVEYEMAGINQVSINVKAGLTFASGLRTILRQDPDIVMIGEIRDGETAEIACKASQTGHFVLSTLHTNDAPASIHRLMDLGIESFMIASAVRAIVGQRLVRKICEHCKGVEEILEEYAKKIKSYLAEYPDAIFYKGKGCVRCKETGYSGRTAIHEVLVMSPEVKKVLAPGVSSFVLKQTASKYGYRPLTLDGLDKAREGTTSIEEVFRVSPPEIITAEVRTEESAEPIGPAAAPTETVNPHHEPDTPYKVLIVDDDAMARKIMHVTLKAKGYEIAEAVNGIEGLKVALEVMPDIILTDYLMPELDGLALVRACKSQVKLKHIPIIMLTSKEEADSEIELMNAGVDDYLNKPVNAERLLARMGRLLRHA